MRRGHLVYENSLRQPETPLDPVFSPVYNPKHFNQVDHRSECILNV